MRSSNTKKFKYCLIITLISVILVRLYFIFSFSAFEVVPEKLVLLLALFVMTVIWVLERNDRRELLAVNKKLHKAKNKIIEEQLNTLKTLVSALEAKDSYTKGHCERVTSYSLMIADKMNLDENFKNILRNAASIHDIGKLKIKDEVLNKPDKLNEEEWKIIRRHPEDAVKILSPLDFLSKEKEIILHHHEKYEGGGYPDGISGENIPLGARILTVADSFDAMNSRRAYREPLSKEKIIEELEKSKGIQFDPVIADIFISIVKTEKL